MKHFVIIVLGVCMTMTASGDVNADDTRLNQVSAGIESLAAPLVPPMLPNALNRGLCLVDDNFDHEGSLVGTWNLVVSRGSISGSVTYDAAGCAYSVSGSTQGRSFTMNLVQTSTSCCESGTATGTVNVRSRQADGQIEWICDGTPTTGGTTWVPCQQ